MLASHRTLNLVMLMIE